jgi:hypothetical protein
MTALDYARLSSEHARLKQIYATTVDRLFAVGFRVTDAEYRKLRNFIEETRAQVEIAGSMLEEHRIAAHSTTALAGRLGGQFRATGADEL